MLSMPIVLFSAGIIGPATVNVAPPVLPVAVREALSRVELRDLLGSIPKPKVGRVSVASDLTGAWLSVPGFDFIRVMELEVSSSTVDAFHGIRFVCGVSATGDYVELGERSGGSSAVFSKRSALESSCLGAMSDVSVEMFVSARGEILIDHIRGRDKQGQFFSRKKNMLTTESTLRFESAMFALSSRLSDVYADAVEVGSDNQLLAGTCNWFDANGNGVNTTCLPDTQCETDHNGSCFVQGALCDCVGNKPANRPAADCALSPGAVCYPNYKCLIQFGANPPCKETGGICDCDKGQACAEDADCGEGMVCIDGSCGFPEPL